MFLEYLKEGKSVQDLAYKYFGRAERKLGTGINIMRKVLQVFYSKIIIK
jgi:hypothetical protein